VEQPMMTPPPKATDKLTRGGQSAIIQFIRAQAPA